ncbi:ANTAR domain-containing response regulator [Fusibacter sp. 3D3]|uniref:ANTAR domain-containing response regulator n=1 Tax=Fusibacter sp. 3D3 TaxID=1048380 RepID=UPI0008530C8E|nr:response regulator [Fusibacter sp. 3D3]GAU75897.1 ethanolamine two-component response regulator [Fusibacter sp. 3D3]
MSRKIVIADDEPITRMNIAEMLEEAGYNVVGQAVDGFDAVELCKKHHPDLVILDVKMPLLDGLMAAKIIKEEGLRCGVILLTAYSGKEFVDKAKEVGVLNYLVKPVTEKAILPAVEIAIHKAEEFQKIKDETEKINERLEARIFIDRAKSSLMKRDEINEEEAYNYIRKMSMDKRCSMKEISRIILLNEETR